MAKYFNGPVSSGFISLLTGKTISGIATGMMGIFLPIFLFKLFGEEYLLVALYYGVSWLVYAIVVTWGAKWLSSFGFKNALIYSAFLGSTFYLSLYLTDTFSIAYMIPLSIIVLIFYRIMYWLPYHIDFATFTSREDRAKEVGVLLAARHVIGALLPIIAGVIIAKFGFNVLFLIGIFVFLVSGIPYLTIPRVKETFSWTYRETWSRFVAKENRNTVAAFFADGMETTVTLIIWPIFMYQILDGDFLRIGIVSTFIITASVFVDLTLGKYIDSGRKESKVLRMGSIFYSLGWILKIFVVTTFQVFFVGAYHSMLQIFTRESFDTLTYEIAADQGHYIDEFTILHEIAVNLGRATLIVLSVPVFLFAGLEWTFVLAAIAALFMNLLKVKNGGLIPPLDRNRII